MYRSLSEQAKKVESADRVLSIRQSKDLGAIFNANPEPIFEANYAEYPGGIAVRATVFQAPCHGSTDSLDETHGDFWRYAPSGLSCSKELLAPHRGGWPGQPIDAGFRLARTKPHARSRWAVSSAGEAPELKRTS